MGHATRKWARYAVEVLAEVGRTVNEEQMLQLSDRHIRVVIELALHKRLRLHGTPLPSWVKRSAADLRREAALIERDLDRKRHEKQNVPPKRRDRDHTPMALA